MNFTATKAPVTTARCNVRRLSICAIAIGSLMGLSSAGQAPSKDTLLISPGDILHISILDMPEMEQRVRVTDSGMVPIQGVGEVKVVPMTPSEAATTIHDRFISAKFLNHPQVSVVVDQYVTQNVTLIGEVKTPGSYPVATPRPILDVIALGGGLDPVADRNILIERQGDREHPISYTLNNDAQQAIRDQVMVYPGDTVVVPKAGIVYVLGDVYRPGGYAMSNNQSQLTLLEVLTIAGGPTKTARLGQVRLLRKADHSDTKLSLGEIEKGKQPDFAMLPGDILYVPFSFGKNLLMSSSSGLMGAASAAAVYAVP
jgi:polysaccharide biosynthesis/export protein